MNGRDTAGRFGPGNPGRPAGARNRTTLAVLELLDGQAEALTQKAVEMALAGDTVALRLCLDRVAPPRRDAPVAFAMPTMTSARDAAEAAGAVLQAVSEGSPGAKSGALGHLGRRAMGLAGSCHRPGPRRRPGPAHAAARIFTRPGRSAARPSLFRRCAAGVRRRFKARISGRRRRTDWSRTLRRWSARRSRRAAFPTRARYGPRG